MQSLCELNDKHYYKLNISALGPVIFENNIVLVVSIVSLWEPMIHGAWPIRTSGTLLAGFMKDNTKRCSILNMLALGIMVSKKSL